MDRMDVLAAAERHFRRRHTRAGVQFDPHVQETLGGEGVVHGQQQYRGLSIYPHSLVVRVAVDGTTSVSGDALRQVDELDVLPRLDVQQAVRIAFKHVRGGSMENCHTRHAPQLARRGYRPRIAAAFPMPNRPTVLSPGPFGEPPQANLVIHRDTMRLAWLVWMYVKGVADYTIVIAADTEDAAILYCAYEAASAVCSSNVFLFNPDEGARVAMRFPRHIVDFPPGIRPMKEFHDWVDKDRAEGNNVRVLIDNGDPRIRVSADGQFIPQNAGDEQVVNAFWLCNFAHDFFSLIGFDEKSGNFQKKNFTGEGKGGDALIVSIVEDAFGEANVRAQNDGKRAELTLGVGRGPHRRPTAFDADVVLHEYAHGVSQRLVGGSQKKNALSEPQSLALGEAWSDYFAITIQNFYRPQPRFTFGAYSSEQPNGARPTEQNPIPYDRFNGHFGMLGVAPFDEQHAAGAIFAAALLRMQEELRALLGDTSGHETGWRLVINSMKSRANPSFLDARDCIVASTADLKSSQGTAIELAIRTAFARYGMGRHARCDHKTKLTGCVPDFNV